MENNYTTFNLDLFKLNETVKKCALDREYTFAKFNKFWNDFVIAQCTFRGFGKNLGKYHVLIEDIKLSEDEFNEYPIDHLWLNNAANPSYYSNWMQWNFLVPGDVILISGYLSPYDDSHARKTTFINTKIERHLWRPQY